MHSSVYAPLSFVLLVIYYFGHYHIGGGTTQTQQ